MAEWETLTPFGEMLQRASPTQCLRMFKIFLHGQEAK
jgi:hypothetical protein